MEKYFKSDLDKLNSIQESLKAHLMNSYPLIYQQFSEFDQDGFRRVSRKKGALLDNWVSDAV